VNLLAIGPECALPGNRPLAQSIHKHGIVRRRTEIPCHLRRGPPAVLDGRISKIREQIRAHGKQPDIHAVQVPVRAPGIVIHPKGSRIHAFAGTQDANVPAGLVNTPEHRARALRFNDLPDPLANSFGIVRSKIMRKSVQ